MNAVEIEQAISELALQPFDATEFPFTFLAAFGNKDTALKRLRTGNNNASDVPGGVLLRNNIHLAVCAAGTVGDTLKALRASVATTKAKAKFILTTDGQTLEAEELASGETIVSAFPDFPNHFGLLLPLAGISTIKEIKDNPIDVRATGRLNKLYVELLSENPAWATDERRSDMNHFMARLAYVAEVGDTIRAPNGESDARLRVVCANGTESNLLRRSLQRALYKDETGRRLSDPDMGPLFGGEAEPEDIESGTIYVLRSKSSHPFVADHRELIHKIGVTGGKVETRIAAADKDATYLLADVEVVATYKLHNLNRTKLENIFHRLFGAAQLDLTIKDRFGNPVKPREWFLVPLQAIDEAVQRIRDGSITGIAYDLSTARLVSKAQ
jgi:hypothetical protein